MKKLVLILVLILGPLMSSGQTTDQQLAQHYYGKGEFDKALIYYERLYETDQSKFTFTRYLECLTETGDDKTAEKLLKKSVNRNRHDSEYSILLAKFCEERGEVDKANTIYNDLILFIRLVCLLNRGGNRFFFR